PGHHGVGGLRRPDRPATEGAGRRDETPPRRVRRLGKRLPSPPGRRWGVLLAAGYLEKPAPHDTPALPAFGRRPRDEPELAYEDPRSRCCLVLAARSVRMEGPPGGRH